VLSKLRNRTWCFSQDLNILIFKSSYAQLPAQPLFLIEKIDNVEISYDGHRSAGWGVAPRSATPPQRRRAA
jgi:hypothetical protein